MVSLPSGAAISAAKLPDPVMEERSNAKPIAIFLIFACITSPSMSLDESLLPNSLLQGADDMKMSYRAVTTTVKAATIWYYSPFLPTPNEFRLHQTDSKTGLIFISYLRGTIKIAMPGASLRAADREKTPFS